jgi:hypothetical protein
MKVNDRVEVIKEIDGSRWGTIKIGMKGTVVNYYMNLRNDPDFKIRFDDNVGGQDGHHWSFCGKDDLKYFKVI